MQACEKLGLTGLIIIGATHSLTDAAFLAEYFLSNGSKTRVIAVPATVDGNIHHKYISTSLGFDTASKIYSQLVGNMLTDSNSAIKYWYFIRLMGRDPSHLALECALQTHPNIVILSEESAFRGETLIDIVNRVCDIIIERSIQKKNYGCVLIPEGLLNHVSAYKNLIEELGVLFSDVKDRAAALELATKLYENEAFLKE
jgi:diphosphate--fructose-6-phosphate 1-phosphotransferase